jgi:transposase
MATACARNRYYRRARLSERKFRDIVRCFAIDLNASDTARMTGISTRSVNPIFLKLRERIAEQVEQHSVFKELPEQPCCNVVALPLPQDATRATDRVPLLFGFHWRDEKVFTELVPERESRVLHALINGRRYPCDLIGPQDWNSRYHGLADLGRGRYLRLQCDASGSPPNVNAPHGLDAFWGFARRRLEQFRGFHRHTLDLHLKETEYRFNHSRDSLYPDLLATLREQPL